jgi:hypothetical protein
MHDRIPNIHSKVPHNLDMPRNASAEMQFLTVTYIESMTYQCYTKKLTILLGTS